ncbi:hypothetical protein ASZ90_018392 [hydrocarbon metagenome]|uniref:Energy-coupling factor transporter transmembrane protein EcfT n=1 Tax=hydrocarbon metagenome TaxID=938273 RepID=A0A0W8E6E3_9ZZZZ
MTEYISLGQYIPVESFLHRLDPRIKIVSTLMLTVAVVSAGTMAELALLATALLVISSLSSIQLAEYWKGITPFLFIILITAVIKIFLVGGTSIVSVWFINITVEGLKSALSLTVRLILIIFSAQILLLTTSIVSLTDGLGILLKPLEKIRFPVHELVMIMTISLRFIPVLLNESRRIRLAQISRGIDFREGPAWDRAQTYFAILVPLINASFQKANDLAEAMEARGYTAGKKRNRLNELSLSRSDYIYLLCISILSSGIII